jgi:hypothetical protein
MAILDHYTDDAAAIDALQPADSPSDRIRVMALAPRITDALGRGVDWAAIEQCLRRLGIKATLPVIKNYYRAALGAPPATGSRTKPNRQSGLGRRPTTIAPPGPHTLVATAKSVSGSVLKIRPDSADL